MDLRLATRDVGGATVVEVGGEVDAYTAPRLRETLSGVVAGGARRLVVDMSATDFLDSTGLGVLVGSLRRVRSMDGTLELVCPSERILKVFRITGLTRVFEIHPDLDTALAAASPAHPAPASGEQPGPS